MRISSKNAAIGSLTDVAHDVTALGAVADKELRASDTAIFVKLSNISKSKIAVLHIENLLFLDIEQL
jgi:hypothetical protein